MNRKGLSPLIATVLLIAFAVALGVMIMTWTQNIPGGVSSCETITMEQQNICFTGEKIRLQVRNVGTTQIEGISLDYSDQIKEGTLKLKDSALSPGANFNRDIDFSKVGNTRVEVIPLIDNGGKLEQCPRPALVVTSLSNC